MATGRCADASTHLDVDEFILDYLIFTATKALLEDYSRLKDRRVEAQEQGASNIPLQLVDSFLIMFRTMHPDHQGSADSRFRLRLLQFTVMFTKRFAPLKTTLRATTLQKSRHQRQEQANAFRSSGDGLGSLDLLDLTEYLAPPDIMRMKEEQLSRDVTPQGHTSNDYDHSAPSISLLDTIPFFMALSAAQNAMQPTTITDIWMRLAAGYMVQAVAEQYLVFRSQRQEVPQEAFAWGFDPLCGAEEGSDAWYINAMFWDEDETVACSWEEIRNEHMQALIPPDGTDLRAHLQTLAANDLSLADFEHYVIEFLNGLLHGQSRPLLMQMESGQVDELSRKRTRALYERIGIAMRAGV